MLLGCCWRGVCSGVGVAGVGRAPIRFGRRPCSAGGGARSAGRGGFTAIPLSQRRVASAGSSAASRLGVPLGTSGLRRINALEAAEAIRNGDAALSDFLLISGVVFFGPAELQLMLSRGELCVVEGREMGALWPQVMALGCP